MRRLLLLVTSCLAASHPELWGEPPDPADIDDGQCVPIKCDFGVAPSQCTRLCALRHYLPVCQPPGDFCLCQRLTRGFLDLVSPDEVLEQPPYQEPSELNVFAFIVPLGNFLREDTIKEEPIRRAHHQELQKIAPEAAKRTHSEHVEDVPDLWTSLDHFWESSDVIDVNVHEGRLYWLFRYVLSGLFLLIVFLVMFELIMCHVQGYEKFGFENVEEEPLPPINEKKFRTLSIV